MPEKFTLTSEERLTMYERIMGEPQTEDFYNISRHELEMLREHSFQSQAVDDIVEELFEFEKFKSAYPNKFRYIRDTLQEHVFIVTHCEFGGNMHLDMERKADRMIAEWIIPHCRVWWRDAVFGPALFGNWHYG